MSYDSQLSATDTPSGHNHVPKHFRLFDLPAEIRNNIYGSIIDNFERKAHKKADQELRATTIKGVLAQLPQSVRNFLRTCKTIWHELLSLLFRSYTWTADLLLRSSPPGQIRTLQKGSWLVKASTISHPTSNNIRHVILRMKDSFLIATTKISVQFAVEVHFINRHYTVAVTNTVRAFIQNERCYPGESATLKSALEDSFEPTLEEVVKAKSKSGEGVTNFTAEGWQGLVIHLKSAYTAWMARTQIPE
jgi:hypothetical protein